MMKILHVSDLHLGKRLGEYSLIEDQIHVLNQILTMIDKEKPDVFIIAGDVYDKTVPSAEAVKVFDEFLVKLSAKKITAFIISGNHDSAERIAFGAKLISLSGIYFSPVYNGEITPISIEDEFGKVNFYSLPFIKPVHVRLAYPDQKIESYNDAIRVAINNVQLNKNQRNVLITHQFVTGASKSGSEEISVGGTDNIDKSIFDDFDYVALGHIHRAQSVGRDTIRYSGTPLKYSFSEINDVKSATIIELKSKGEVNLKTIEFTPLRGLSEIRGTYNEIMSKEFYQNTTYLNDFISIVLTDEQDVPNVKAKLSTVYKNIFKIEYDNERTRSNSMIDGATNIEKSPKELFEELYKLQNNVELTEEQDKILTETMQRVWEDEL